jgi:hypothetical protein
MSSVNPPVTVDTMGICGVPKDRLVASARNSARKGVISGEWKACETGNRLVRWPWAAKRAAISTTTSSTPETTTESGPFTAAMFTLVVIKGATAAGGAWIANIAPLVGRAWMRRPRVVTRAQASGRDSTPATWAAVISPMEWPTR